MSKTPLGTFCTCGHQLGNHWDRRNEKDKRPCSACLCHDFSEKPDEMPGFTGYDTSVSRGKLRVVALTDDELWVLQRMLEAARDNDRLNEEMVEDLGEGQEELYDSAEQTLSDIYTSLAKKLS